MAFHPERRHLVCRTCGARLAWTEGSNRGWELVRTAEEAATRHFDPSAGVGVAFLADVTPASQDGRTYRFLATDGHGGFEEVDAEVSGSVACIVGPRAMAPSVLERAIRARAFGYDRELGRLTQLAESGPLRMQVDELSRESVG